MLETILCSELIPIRFHIGKELWYHLECCRFDLCSCVFGIFVVRYAYFDYQRSSSISRKFWSNSVIIFVASLFVRILEIEATSFYRNAFQHSRLLFEVYWLYLFLLVGGGQELICSSSFGFDSLLLVAGYTFLLMWLFNFAWCLLLLSGFFNLRIKNALRLLLFRFCTRSPKKIPMQSRLAFYTNPQRRRSRKMYIPPQFFFNVQDFLEVFLYRTFAHTQEGFFC